MRVDHPGKHFTYRSIWFESISSLSEVKKDCSQDVIFIHQNEQPIGNARAVDCQNFYTLILDISIGENDLFGGFSKTVRNEIHRSEREAVECEIFTSEKIMHNKKLLQEFADIYQQMYASKGLNQTLNTQELLCYAKNEMLVVTCARVNGSSAIYHSYITHNDRVRLFQSCSDFREKDKSEGYAIGRANKYLHWNDIKFFKSHGVRYYDWGGVSSIDSPNGIDMFKMSFGGTVVTEYNIKIYHSRKARVYWGLTRRK